MIGFAIDGILGFSVAPLRFILGLGFAISALSLLVGLVAIVAQARRFGSRRFRDGLR